MEKLYSKNQVKVAAKLSSSQESIQGSPYLGHPESNQRLIRREANPRGPLIQKLRNDLQKIEEKEEEEKKLGKKARFTFKVKNPLKKELRKSESPDNQHQLRKTSKDKILHGEIAKQFEWKKKKRVAHYRLSQLRDLRPEVNLEPNSGQFTSIFEKPQSGAFETKNGEKHDQKKSVDLRSEVDSKFKVSTLLSKKRKQFAVKDQAQEHLKIRERKIHSNKNL